MNILGQFSIILGILFISELLVGFFSLPIPGTILGMIVLIILLITKIIKLEWVEDIADVMSRHMGIMFVPPGVALINYLDLLRGQLIKVLFIGIVSIISIMVVTGKVIDLLISIKGENK